MPVGRTIIGGIAAVQTPMGKDIIMVFAVCA